MVPFQEYVYGVFPELTLMLIDPLVPPLQVGELDDDNVTIGEGVVEIETEADLVHNAASVIVTTKVPPLSPVAVDVDWVGLVFHEYVKPEFPPEAVAVAVPLVAAQERLEDVNEIEIALGSVILMVNGV